MLSIDAQARALAHFDVTILRNRFIPHQPTDKQAEFLFCAGERELLYGGAAGGGKSDALLIAALQYVHVPNYRALLLRRTFADLALPGALMDRARSWLAPTDAKWVASEKSWAFPSGATVTFGYLENEADKFRYQGSEFQFVGFDELTQFTETQYTYLFSRQRRLEGSNVPLRMRAATNPGGVGHAWVRRRFIDPATRTASFISAKVTDNPYIDQVEYNESLLLLDAATRAQLRDGNWDVDDPAALWKREWIERNRVLRIPDDVQHVKAHVAIDPSATSTGDECGIMSGVWGSDKIMYLLHDDSMQGSPLAWGKAAVRAYHRIKGDKIIYESNNGGEMCKLTINTVDPRIPTHKVWASRGKQARAQPTAAITEQNHVKFVGEFSKLEAELCGWVPGTTKESPNRLDAFVWLEYSFSKRGERVVTIG